jgi:hypothetical protein
MEKSTKLIVAAIGLGGLGYFLYKKGLFAKTTTTEVAKDVKKVDDVVKKVEDIVKDVIDTSKKTAVEPLDKEIVLDSKLLKPFPKLIEEPYIPIFKEDLIYPIDITYPVEPKPIFIPSYNNPYLNENLGFRDNTYFDQPTRIDYGTGKYNQDVVYDYDEKDMANVRFNQYIYA